MSVTLTVEEPAWRVKSRPCEYFRRGRCVFGEDRCNFLHILNEWNPDESTFINSTLTSRKAPDVKIYPETPPSASLRSIRSPPRSPRTTNLLLALKGIIRDDEEGEYVDDLSFEAVDDFDNQNSGRTIQQTETVPVFHDPVYDDSESSPSPTNSGLLSPVEFSDLQLKHFSLVRDAHRASLSQEYDPFGAAGSQWVSPSPMVRSPPRSPAPTSTFELIASPFGSPSNRLLVNPMSPRLNPFTPRVPIPPSPLASRFDDSEDIQQPELDLDSPTDYKEKEMQMQEEDQTARVPELPLDDEDEYTGPLTTRWDSEDTVRPFHLNPPPPRKSKTKALDGPANPSLGIQEEVKEALRRRSESPLDYFQTPETVRPPAFSPEDVEADSTSRAQASADDETAQLAYLASSPDEEVDELPGSVEEDDTINSLYDVYSDIDSESEQGEDEEQDDNDEDVCISRALPSSLKLISPTASPSTALPAYHERPSPKSTHSSSPPSARVFTPQPPTPPSPPVLVPYDKNSTDESTPLSALPRFSSSIRNSKLRPLRLSTISTTINPLPMTPPSFSPSGASVHAPSTSKNIIESSPNDPRLSIASTHVPSLSASTSDFALSNNPLLSSTLSPPIYPRHGTTENSMPASSPLSAPPAVASEQHSMIPSTQRRSSIYYIREKQNGLQQTYSDAQGPKSAPLPTVKDSVKSGSARSSSASSHHAPSRTEASRTPNHSPPTKSRHSSAASLSVPPRIDNLIRVPSPSPVLRPDSSPVRVSTPRPPALLFAIASDNPEEVERVLEHGDNAKEPVSANAMIGPQAQSALEFTLENDALKNKLGIVKKLLKFGADPSRTKLNEGTPDDVELDSATRYYLERAGTATARRIDALMKRSAFAPLTRMRYGIIGQDRALEQLYRVLSIQTEKISKSPVVVFLCGPSGHGKSLLAHQFGSLLEVPIHTVNMTTLRSADDIWRSYSISSNEDAPPQQLIEFLVNNEGKRCVVVLDEIEKTEQKALWSLLVPWELGRCTFEANSRTIDVRNVIWVGTSNIGNDVILNYHESRQQPEEMLTRDEYVELMGILRPHVSDQLGASVLSRVSAILPFVPFTTAEKKALASEFLQESAAEHLVQGLSGEQKETVVSDSIKDWVPSEGARSLYRAVSNLLIDSMDF